MTLSNKHLTPVLLGDPITAYDELGVERKRQFCHDGKKFLRALADTIGLHSGDYDLRWNAAGIAGSGEVTLHADFLYVQISKSPYPDILYRSCESRHDCQGGLNRFAHFIDLRNANRLMVFLAECRLLSRPEGFCDLMSFSWRGTRVRPVFGLHRQGTLALALVVHRDETRLIANGLSDGTHVAIVSTHLLNFPKQHCGSHVVVTDDKCNNLGVTPHLIDAEIIESAPVETTGHSSHPIHAYRLTPAAQRLCDAQLLRFKKAA